MRDGVTSEEIDRVARPGLDDWDESDRAVLGLVDAMCAGAVDDAIRTEAARHHDPASLVEPAWTVGQYVSLSMITDALGVEPEPGLDLCPPGGTP